MPFIDITGNTYNRLTVLEEVLPRQKPAKWLCQCSCGNKKSVIGASLKNGSTKSCGCLHIETNKKQFTKHGEYKGKLYAIHRAIIQRCTNPNHKTFNLYGGRGISMCSAWLEFTTFQGWAIQAGYRENLSLDRKNPDGNYSPENCHWTSYQYQARNRRAQQGHTSQYIGVHWDTDRKKWVASIGIQGKTIALGRYISEIAAAKARDSYIKQHNLIGFVFNFP